MQSCTSVTLLVVSYLTMTSLAMQSGKYAVMTNSSDAQVCSTDPPSQVLPIYPGGDKQCGLTCMVFWCPFFQFKSAIQIQCEFFNQFPVNFESVANCIGYQPAAGFPADCSCPFTNNGMLYNGCVPGVTCWTVNRTASTAITGVTTTTVNTGVLSVPAQSIFGWIIWMRRNGPTSYNWTLPWASYKSGFGSISGDFWLGLENIHLLTSASRYRLRIELQVLSTATWYSVEYWSFTVGDENSTQYQLNVNGFSGETGNGMQYVNQPGCYNYQYPNGMKFSTYDMDNDHHYINCAEQRGGGWWFNGCSRSCPTCSQAYFWWLNGTTTATSCPYNTLAEVHMMIKLQ